MYIICILFYLQVFLFCLDKLKSIENWNLKTMIRNKENAQCRPAFLTEFSIMYCLFSPKKFQCVNKHLTPKL